MTDTVVSSSMSVCWKHYAVAVHDNRQQSTKAMDGMQHLILLEVTMEYWYVHVALVGQIEHVVSLSMILSQQCGRL